MDHLECDCEHEYDLCQMCEFDLEAEYDYWIYSQRMESR